MEIFNSIRNVYRKITGQISLKQEQDYRTSNGYAGKIVKASAEENLAVNLELQRRVYNAEGRTKEAYVIEERAAPLLEKYKSSWNPERRNIFDGEFKLTVANYVKECFGNQATKEESKRIYRSLMDSYKEVYQKSSSNEIINLERNIKKMTQKAVEKRKSQNPLERYVESVYDVSDKAKKKVVSQLQAHQKARDIIDEESDNILEIKVLAYRLEEDSKYAEEKRKLRERQEAYRRLMSGKTLACAA